MPGTGIAVDVLSRLERQVDGDVCPIPKPTTNTDRPAESFDAVSKAY
jgi:hypothetical protein